MKVAETWITLIGILMIVFWCGLCTGDLLAERRAKKSTEGRVTFSIPLGIMRADKFMLAMAAVLEQVEDEIDKENERGNITGP